MVRTERRFGLATAPNDAGRSQRLLAGFGEGKEIVDERSEERRLPNVTIWLCVEYGVVASLNTFLGLGAASKIACPRPASVGVLWAGWSPLALLAIHRRFQSGYVYQVAVASGVIKTIADDKLGRDIESQIFDVNFDR